MKPDFTIAEKLLLAALEVRETGKTFTAEELVVKAWEMFPDSFGLAGYSDRYPDSNRVLTNIMGSKGMRGKGWLRKVGQKQYRVTSKALGDGAQLRELAPNSRGETGALRAELDRKTSAEMDRLVSTRAAHKVFDGQQEALTFTDACGFWDITVRSNASTLKVRLHEVSVLLDQALQIAEVSDGRGLRLPQRDLTREDIRALAQSHAWMQEEFAAQLGVIRKRTDERTKKVPRVK